MKTASESSTTRKTFLSLSAIFPLLLSGCGDSVPNGFAHAHIVKMEVVGVSEEVEMSEIVDILDNQLQDCRVFAHAQSSNTYVSIVTEKRNPLCRDRLGPVVNQAWGAEAVLVSEFYELISEKGAPFYTEHEHKNLPDFVLRFEGQLSPDAQRKVISSIQHYIPFHVQVLSTSFPSYFQITLWPFTDVDNLIHHMQASFGSEVLKQDANRAYFRMK